MKRISGNHLRRTWFVFLLLLPLSCGVKDPQQANDQPAVGSGNLPAGVILTNAKKFLVLPSVSSVPTGQVTILYKIVTDGIDPIVAPNYALNVSYRMPDMPEMPVTPAKIEYPAVGQAQVTYNIVMGGRWEMTLNLQKSGTTVDTVVFSYNVKD